MKTAKKNLSPHEKEILLLISEWRRTKEIAAKLKITVRTKETHRNNINKNLGTHNAAKAIHKARAQKLI